MSDRCGAIGGTCEKGPKGHHKCGDRHMRSGGKVHTTHTCKHCGATFT